MYGMAVLYHFPLPHQSDGFKNLARRLAGHGESESGIPLFESRFSHQLHRNSDLIFIKEQDSQNCVLLCRTCVVRRLSLSLVGVRHIAVSHNHTNSWRDKQPRNFRVHPFLYPFKPEPDYGSLLNRSHRRHRFP